MGCFEHDFGGYSCFERIDPAAHAEAPSVARLETGESVFGSGRRQVVALLFGEFEEAVGD